jgi:hypothetical protein
LKYTTDPKTCEHKRGELDAEALRGTPPPEGTSISTKIQIAGNTTSSSPPPGAPLASTLYTHRSSGIPHPPAAKATGGGGGIRRTPGGEVELGEDFRNSPLFTVDERGEVQGYFFQKIFLHITCQCCTVCIDAV